MKDGIFGTDGIRGRANEYPVVAETMMAVARAAGRRFARSGTDARVIIGKDTRLSGYMIENALVAGFTSVGMNVSLTGPVPTPAVGMLTRTLRADLGVMISASHNPFDDNGIKLFGPDGIKLCDADQAAIEAECTGAVPGVAAHLMGRATRIDGAAERYVEFVKQTLPRHVRLSGLKVVVDAANGAAFRVARQLIWELGAEVVAVGCDPDGVNINDGCGATAPRRAQDKVLEVGADLGLTLDGDADRVLLIDERGRLVDGDQLMALIATRAGRAGHLRGDAVVATIMSNFGLERHLAEHGIGLVRTGVGDRLVFEKMREIGANVGGEQSGHIILSDYTTTGDGLMSGLQALVEMAETGVPASQALLRFDPTPQNLKNVRVARGTRPLEDATVRAAIDAARARLGDTGRLVVRASGTEPVIRIMAEGEDRAILPGILDALGEAILQVAAPARPIDTARIVAMAPAGGMRPTNQPDAVGIPGE